MEKLENREYHGVVATTVVREGFNLEVDAIINHTSPHSAIDMIQRSGRAGRHDEPAEIVNLATKYEQLFLYSVQGRVRRLATADLNAIGSGAPIQSDPHGSSHGGKKPAKVPHWAAQPLLFEPYSKQV